MSDKSRTKRHEVARLLERQILTGRFAPGSKLTELRLAAELKVSQASLREALQELEGLGLVVKYPNKGTFVINLDELDLAHIYQVRRELEPLACSLAAGQMSRQKLDALRLCLQQMRAAAADRDHQSYLNADFRFHSLIWESQQNEYLVKLLKEICLPLFANDLIRRHSNAFTDFSLAIRQHERILRSLQTGDSHLVSKVVRRLMVRFLRQDLSDLRRTREMAETSRDLDESVSLPTAVPFV
ncbi:MAG: GntR family transcriptional regulator [Acidobacteriota bacterium]